MKFYILILFACFSLLPAQTVVPFDSLKLRDVQGIFADDYSNIYLYRTKNFSLIKYNNGSTLQGSLMLTVPFKVQSVENLLNIPLFSENAQEIMFVDQNLNLMEKIGLQEFGFIKMAYFEEHGKAWLLDESTKRLLHYNYREKKIISSYTLNLDFQELRDMLVFDEKIYLLFQNSFQVSDFKGKQIFSATLNNPVRLRRENENIFIMGSNQVWLYHSSKGLKSVFYKPAARFVDKNSQSYFVIEGNNLYIYGLKKAGEFLNNHNAESIF